MLGTQSLNLDMFLCPSLKKGARTRNRERVSGARQNDLGTAQRSISLLKPCIGTPTFKEGPVGQLLGSLKSGQQGLTGMHGPLQTDSFDGSLIGNELEPLRWYP